MGKLSAAKRVVSFCRTFLKTKLQWTSQHQAPTGLHESIHLHKITRLHKIAWRSLPLVLSVIRIIKLYAILSFLFVLMICINHQAEYILIIMYLLIYPSHVFLDIWLQKVSYLAVHFLPILGKIRNIYLPTGSLLYYKWNYFYEAK